MFVLLFVVALGIGAFSLGMYAYGKGVLGKCFIGAALLFNPITGSVCWVILVMVVVGMMLHNSGLAEWWAGEDGSRI